MKAFDYVRGFEFDLSMYTGAPHVVAVNSGTSALQLALEYWARADQITTVILPDRTYRSVANMADRAGLGVIFHKKAWRGAYQIEPTNIWDCALRLAPGMYKAGTIQCLSFHPQKPLACSAGGGAILHDDPVMDKWLRKMRFDGRDEGVSIHDSSWDVIGAHCYMFPGQAGEALHRLNIYSAKYPKKAPDAEQPKYESLSSKWRKA
jgi:dTDP-4-amino-4,6-dideoxygalactose transaminase